MTLNISITNEVKQRIQTEKSYIEFVKEIEHQVEQALEYIDYAIECKSNKFVFYNEEHYSKIEIPIRNMLLFLLNTYQTAQKKSPDEFMEDRLTFSLAIDHLHCAARHLVFYFENDNFDLVKLEHKINFHLIKYYDLKQLAIESMYNKFLIFKKELSALEEMISSTNELIE
ncbi:hypothetical protein [Bacillus sp. JJ722]|uniref:hypothetical protein n=1 Tax=Bacillus sp. JJ722 TaxID=3122973 RepID=UPI002FFD7E29